MTLYIRPLLSHGSLQPTAPFPMITEHEPARCSVCLGATWCHNYLTQRGCCSYW